MGVIALLIAATAALASCVKEAGLEPQEQNPNQVVIKAVAAQTKTLLGADGTSVVWEDNDAIKVVLKGSAYELQDFTATEIAGSAADFTGEFGDEIRYEDDTKAYAVYPADAVASDGANVTISHTLPETQDGVIASEMNLSYATLSMDALNSGTAAAEFKNALALLKVIVPEGVKTVSLTSSNETLVGTIGFNDPLTNGTMTRKSVTDGSKTVTLSKDGDDDLAGTHNLLVYPANAGNLTLKMVGTDDVTTYEKTISGVVFKASEYRTIDLTKIFNMPIEDEIKVSPTGEQVTIPVVAAEDYEYAVAIESGKDWIREVQNPAVKSFNKQEIAFEVDLNDTGSAREAEVTITWGDNRSKTFTVSQAALVLDFVYVDPSDQESGLIKWEETFGVYASEDEAASESNPKATFTNGFTISISDDFTKGTYKINGIFAYKDRFSGETGGIYYADYADGILTIYNETAENQSYNFTENTVNLTYDSVNNTFTSSSTIQFGYKYNNADLTNGGFIGGYSVKVKEAIDMDLLNSFANTYTYSYDNSDEGLEVIVSVVDDYLLFTNMFPYVSYSTTYTGTYKGLVSPDGKTITLSNLSDHGYYGSLTSGVLTVEDDGSLTAESINFQGYTINNFVANIKPVEGGGDDDNDLNKFIGTYAESYKLYNSSTSNTLTISVDGDKLILTNMFGAYSMFGTYKAELSNDGTSLTIVEEVSSISMGSCLNNVLTVSEEGGKIVLSAEGLCIDPYSGDSVIKEYTATQN